jgi:uncharacterized protein YybS (DUF2232 family)
MMMQRGLYVALAAVAGYALFGTFAALGFAAVAVNIFTPLPAAYVGMRFGSPAALVAVVLTGLLVFLASSQATALMYLIQFGIPAALLPWLLNRRISWDKAVAATLWTMVAVSLVGLLVVAAVDGQSPFTLAGHLIDSEIAQTKSAMQEMFTVADLPADQKQEVSQALENMAGFLQKAYPGMTITVTGVMTLGLVWLLIAAGFTVAFVDGFAGTFALNLLVILLPVYFLQGLAVIDCFFRRKAFSPIFRAIGYLLLTLINPLPMVVTGIGVFDMWADFRKPREPKS